MLHRYKLIHLCFFARTASRGGEGRGGSVGKLTKAARNCRVGERSPLSWKPNSFATLATLQEIYRKKTVLVSAGMQIKLVRPIIIS